MPSPMPIALRLLFLALLLLLALLFLWQNLTPLVAVVFLGAQLPELLLSLWILGAFGLGIGISTGFGLLLHWARRSRLLSKNRLNFSMNAIDRLRLENYKGLHDQRLFQCINPINPNSTSSL